MVFITQFPGFRWPKLTEIFAFLDEKFQTWPMSKDDNLILDILLNNIFERGKRKNKC